MKQCKVAKLTIEEEERFLNLIVPSVKEVRVLHEALMLKD